MATAVIREKESFRAIQLTLLAFIALKSWTCQPVTHAENLLQRNSIKCNLCLTKVHLKCNYLNDVDSQHIRFSKKTWHCCNCSKDLFPFRTINNFKLYSLLSDRFYCDSDSNKSCLTLKPPKNLSHVFNEFNSFCSDINNTPENVMNSYYYYIDQLQTLKKIIDKSSLSLFHLNTCLFSKNIDDFEHLICQQSLILILQLFLNQE